MATLTINDNPSISDTIVLTLLTPDAQGCHLSNPYKVNKLVIYYVERNFSSGNYSSYQDKIYDVDKLNAAITAEAVACANPTEANIIESKRLRAIAESNMTNTPFHFNEASPIHIVGNDSFPAWLSTDLDNSFLTLVEEDEDGNPVYGQYTYTWQPQGVREGDYFICWTWTPLIAGDSLSSHVKFYIKGDTQVTTSIPSHYTNPNKYTTLLDKYTPEMFKLAISNDDRSPDVLDKFNQSVALGFNVLEDLANQMVDLQDSNSIHEALIPYLSNLFNLKLKSNDPTRWRGQIKRAIPLYKMKGTKRGLIEAMEHAAINVMGLTQLWEITSSHTWQETFVYDGVLDEFELEKVALTIDYDNFELWIRPQDSDTWVSLNSDYIEFITSDGITTMIWTGSNLSVSPIDLIEGDEIRVLYLYTAIANPTDQAIEDYIRTLPLMDQREERDQVYPLKNWNVRVIAENDAMFNLVIPTRHPYHEFIVYGKVRTEFPYSENIYNMEEYNGQIRSSKDPCDIDRNFVDPCTSCISSSYNIDLEIEDLSDDRVLEAKEVLKEYAPFHAVLHTFNFIGGVNEFVESPLEQIEALVSINNHQFVLSGESQMYFNRIIDLVETQGINRDQLAESVTALTSTSAIAYNDEVVMFCPGSKLDSLGMSLDGNATLNILAPSPLAGYYDITNPSGNVVTIDLTGGPASEPINNCNNLFATDNTINSCAFTFNINNLILDGTLCDIAQDNLYVLYDYAQNFGLLGTKSLFDVDQGTAVSAWKISIPAYSGTAYTIENVLPNGGLVLVNHGGLPSSSVEDISYTLLNPSAVVKATGTSNNEIEIKNRGRVTALSPSVLPIDNVVKLNNNYFNNDYLIIGYVPLTDDQFYIDGYSAGDSNGVNLQIDQRIIAGEVGYFTHRGLKIKIAGNLEDSLGIQNGVNSLVVADEGIENSGFKENFILSIGSDNYFITEIDGDNPSGYTTITISGPDYYWETLSSGGTAVFVTIYKYNKNGATIMGQQFDLPEHTFRTIDRSGRPVIDKIDQDGTITGLSLQNGNEFSESVNQNESIGFTIEYGDGTTEQGEL